MAGSIISPVEAGMLLRKEGDQRPVILDVRTPPEFEAMHVDGALLHPVQDLDAKRFVAENPAVASRGLVVFCQKGGRARTAMQKFEAAGVDIRLMVVDGGMDAWHAAGLPVQTGVSRVISLERQVRIMAGGGILTFTILGALVSPWFLIGGGAMAFGLLMAGITDLCPAAMMLARMPWNRGSLPKGTTSCSVKN